MKIQKILLSLSLVLSAALVLAAPASAEPRGERHHTRIVEALELDEGRAEEVRQIMQSFNEKSHALHQEVRREMKALHADRNEQLRSVLTEEEMAKLEEMRSEMRKDRGKKFHKGHHGKSQKHKHHQ